ncbi:MAG: biotin/lipoyl-binding protein [Clostridia bacterium]|nr:biotin/lipoyl-binding protein [Clostridia bacterium]
MKKYMVTVNGIDFEVTVEDANGAPSAAPAPAPAPAAAPAAPAAVPAGGEQITCPMPGTIVKVPVKAGQAVKKGDVLCIFEAMKMENEVMAPRDGVVASVNVNEGASVNSGDVLLVLG